jgi:hypothetical protein
MRGIGAAFGIEGEITSGRAFFGAPTKALGGEMIARPCGIRSGFGFSGGSATWLEPSEASPRLGVVRIERKNALQDTRAFFLVRAIEMNARDFAKDTDRLLFLLKTEERVAKQLERLDVRAGRL